MKNSKDYVRPKEYKFHYKGTNTLRSLLANPKDKDPKRTKVGSYITTNAHISIAQMLI